MTSEYVPDIDMTPEEPAAVSVKTAEQFIHWQTQLTALMDSKFFQLGIQNVAKAVIVQDARLPTRLSPQEMDDQLVLASQLKFTLAQLALELSIYRNRLKREYDIWYAEYYRKSTDALLLKQRMEVKDKVRTLSNVKVTKDDIHNYLIETYVHEYRARTSFLDEIEEAHGFAQNLVAHFDSLPYTLKLVLRDNR